MNSIRQTLSLLALLVWSGLMMAAPRSRAEARVLALQCASERGFQLTSTLPNRAPGQTGVDEVAPYYVFAHQGAQGFTIIAGDDRMPDVVGYSNKGSFDTNDLPDGLRYFLESYAQTVACLDKTTGTSMAPRKVIARPREVVAPLMTTTWSQRAPYNNLCPVRNGQHCLVGCVATAMAQILYYHQNLKSQWTTIPSYTSKGGYGGTLPAIIGERVYQWDMIRPDYRSSYTQAEADAVAKLCFHCSQSVEMMFDTSVSGSYDDLVPDALAKYFGMSASTLNILNCNNVSRSMWVGMVDNELEAMRPVYIRGIDLQGAHAFVCDGRDLRGLYHINWGWGGSGNGFYDMANLNAYGTDDNGYSNQNLIITGIQLPEEQATYSASLRLKRLLASLSLDGYHPGMRPGQCDQARYEAFTATVAQAQQCVEDEGDGLTATQIDALYQNLRKQYKNLQSSIVPFADGYYYIPAAVTYGGVTKALSVTDDYMTWNTLSHKDARFLWHLTFDSQTGGYILRHASTGYVPATVYAGGSVWQDQSGDDVTVHLEPVAYDELQGLSVAIRRVDQVDDNVFFYRNGHESSSSTQGRVVGWVSSELASHWFLEAVDDTTALSLLGGTSSDQDGSDLATRVQILTERAKMVIATVDEDVLVKGTTKLITSVDQLSSPYLEPQEGSLSGMIDDNASTYWHSNYLNGTEKPGVHYFQVKVTNPETLQMAYFAFTRRSGVLNDHVTMWGVYGTNDSEAEKKACTKLATVSTPYTYAGESLTGQPFPTEGYQYLRFYFEATNTTRGYGHVAEFQLYPITSVVNDQRDVAKPLVEDLQKVLDEAPETPTEAYYNCLVKAYQNLVAEYVDVNVLSDVYTLHYNQARSLSKGRIPGTFQIRKVAEYQKALYDVETAIESEVAYMNGAQKRMLIDNLSVAAKTALDSYMPYVEGNYYLISALGFGIPGNYTLKTLYIEDGQAKWGDLESAAQSVWHVVPAATAGDYMLSNMATGEGFAPFVYNGKVTTQAETSQMTFVPGGTDTTLGCRFSLHHSGDASTYLNLVGYNGGDGDEGEVRGGGSGLENTTSLWCLYPANEGSDMRLALDKLIESADSLVLAGAETVFKTNPAKIITKATQLSCPYNDPKEGTLANLLDGKSSTYWSSVYSQGRVPDGLHYMDVDLSTSRQGVLQMRLVRRQSVEEGHITRFGVETSEDGLTWTFRQDLDIPYNGEGETVKTYFGLPTGTRHLRLCFDVTNSESGYVQLAELQLYQPSTLMKVKSNKLNALYQALATAREKDQPNQADVDTLQLAIDTYLGVVGVGETMEKPSEEGSSLIYTLDGLCHSKPVKGLNVIGGKKVVLP